jgi:exonuclease VII large subunit
VSSRCEFSRTSLSCASGRLEALSPLSILHRGFAAVSKSLSGATVQVASQLEKGDALNVCFSDGIAACEVVNINLCNPLKLDSKQTGN